MTRRKIMFLFITCSFLLMAACSKQTEDQQVQDSVAANTDDQEVTEENGGDNFPTAAQTIEELMEQPPGTLVEEFMDPDIEASRTVNFVHYLRFYEDTFKSVVENDLPGYFKEHPEADADHVYNYLVYTLGSGQYKKYYEQLKDFDHGYIMPELPDGEDEIKRAKAQKTNIVVLMDASGSMKAEIQGETMMDLAKDAIDQFTSGLDDTVNIALFAYGHKGKGTEADRQLSCASIDNLYPLNAYNEESFHEALNSFQASGWTPLAGAMEKAREYLSDYDREQYRNIIYIVSDGVETCGGDPMKAAKRLHDSQIEAKVNIIGFDVDDEGQNQLKQVAEAGGGQYATVRNQSEFEEVLIHKWQPSRMQVITQQGVKLQDSVWKMEELIDLYGRLTNLATRESQRITDAASFLRNEGYISDEAADEVIETAKQQQEMRNTHFEELKNQKNDEAEAAKEEIDEAVNEWKEEWSGVLE
ncbi:VWA domain-containing protein [Sporosarcina cascadiensis]|uniref:VWA domain-containing protein n=1 Tax=Sporosarcina cascadiensis TaxID=2660747 RepID=UPI00129A43AE|nr:VWA domain-containing protein [Sporosarcina cascadiensis]